MESLYAETRPPDTLRNAVVKLWVFQGVLRDRVLPSGSSDLIFHVGSVPTASGGGERRVMPRSILAGPLTQPIKLSTEGQAIAVGVRFRPYGLSWLFGLDMAELVDNAIDLSSVVHTRHADLLDMLGAHTTARERFSAMIGYLRSISSHATHCGRTARAVEAIVSAPPGLRIREIAGSVGVTEQTLQRDFRRQIGLTPKQFQRVVRLKRATDYAKRTPSEPWSTIAARFGYADQSHLIRDCRRLYHRTPAQPSSPGTEFVNAMSL